MGGRSSCVRCAAVVARNRALPRQPWPRLSTGAGRACASGAVPRALPLMLAGLMPAAVRPPGPQEFYECESASLSGAHSRVQSVDLTNFVAIDKGGSGANLLAAAGAAGGGSAPIPMRRSGSRTSLPAPDSATSSPTRTPLASSSRGGVQPPAVVAALAAAAAGGGQPDWLVKEGPPPRRRDRLPKPQQAEKSVRWAALQPAGSQLGGRHIRGALQGVIRPALPQRLPRLLLVTRCSEAGSSLLCASPCFSYASCSAVCLCSLLPLLPAACGPSSRIWWARTSHGCVCPSTSMSRCRRCRCVSAAWLCLAWQACCAAQGSQCAWQQSAAVVAAVPASQTGAKLQLARPPGRVW